MNLKRQWSFSFLLTFAMMLILQYQGATLKTEISPLGIVDLEFANTTARVSQLLKVWEFNTIQVNIILDFFFIACFTWFFTNCIKAVLKITHNNFSLQFGKMLIPITLVAGILDVIEDILMLCSIHGINLKYGLPFTPFVAGIKFFLIFIVLLYVLTNLLLLGFRHVFSKN